MAGNPPPCANIASGNQAFFRQLLADGITCVFGNPGSSEENLFETLMEPEFQAFRYYMALQEQSAVAMADAYSRAVKKTTIVQLHSYAGLANGLGMIYAAKRGYSPLVVIAGEAGLRYEALDGQMAADLVSMTRPFVKADGNGPCAWRVVDPGSLLRLLRRAIKTAAAPPCGPVFLALPMDVLDQPNYETVTPTSFPNTRVVPPMDMLGQIARLLAAAEKPLFLIGDGIAASGAQDELAAAAECLGAAVWGVNNSEVNIDPSNPHYQGDTGHMFGKISTGVTSAADTVLICGTTIMPEVFPALEGVFAPGAAVIHLDLNLYEIGKNFPVTIGALADPKAALALLLPLLQNEMTAERQKQARQRSQQLARQKKQKWQDELSQDLQREQAGALQASGFLRQLGERLKRLASPALIFDEALTHSADVTRYLPVDRPGTYFQTRAGMLGTGLPGAVGLKAAHPDSMVFGFAGDGGGIMVIQALNTAARYGLGVKFIVLNNRSYRILKLNLHEYRLETGGTADAPYPREFDLTGLDFVRLAEGMGIGGLRVTRPEDIPRALDAAFADDKPLLIELMIND